MKSNILLLSLCFITFCSVAETEVYAQQPAGETDVAEKAEIEADRLQQLLDLDDWQVFYVDSTLKHDYPALMAEYDQLGASKVHNQSMYQMVYDKWMDQIDRTYKKIFSEEQWAAYLKSGAARAQKAREKRKIKGY